MSELLPSLMAAKIRDGLVDYLTTSFALTDDTAATGLADFLEHPAHGIFRGPYIRTRLPFRPAEDGWQDSLDWTPPFTPYRHQATAYQRLSTRHLKPGERPQPTIVTTGVSAASRARSVASSSGFTPRRRVMPNALTFACFSFTRRISRKNASSFGLLIGKPPSM